MSRFKENLILGSVVLLIGAVGFPVVYYVATEIDSVLPNSKLEKTVAEHPKPAEKVEEKKPEPVVRTATISGSGDILYHDTLYWAAQTPEGYDFSINFREIKDLISSMDLALGDFEGTIRPDAPLSGYPLFNAPPQTAQAIKDAGFDAMDLAHNHILDMGIPGLLSTMETFEEVGIPTFGVRKTAEDPILVKEVNGIKVAVVGFAYGFNGLENGLTPEEYATHLADLDPERVKATLAKAEELADVTVVFPQAGVEYALAPVPEKAELYKQMIDWGADIIFGGHPHVIQPTEKVMKDGQEKFIIYSMGNLISDQRLETVDNIWTERGVIMEVQISKTDDQPVVITGVKAHPTWVAKLANSRYRNGYPLYDYTTYLAADFLPGGKYENLFDPATTQRIRTAHQEVTELLAVPEFGK